MNTTTEDWPEIGYTLPALFVGHGSPMNAIQDNEFSREWAELGRKLPKPRAILCISAHWETAGTRITGMERPSTLHDFGGFPPALFEVKYPAPGHPGLARWIARNLGVPVELDFDWGLDHGAWSVLCRMLPDADIPVLQLSLDRNLSPSDHYAVGRSLRALRDRGVLIVGSGNIVHNLRALVWTEAAQVWAIEFDAQIGDLIEAGDSEAVIHWDRLGATARLAVPTPEHFLPLLYILALRDPHEPVAFFTNRVTLGAISMRSVWVGATAKD